MARILREEVMSPPGGWANVALWYTVQKQYRENGKEDSLTQTRESGHTLHTLPDLRFSRLSGCWPSSCGTRETHPIGSA